MWSVLNTTQTRVVSKTLTKVNTYYEHFSQSATQSFHNLLDYDFAVSYYIDGEILTVPIPDSEERIDVPRDILNTVQTERLVERIYGHTKNPHYADGLKKELSNIAKEIENLQQTGQETNKSKVSIVKTRAATSIFPYHYRCFLNPKYLRTIFVLVQKQEFMRNLILNGKVFEMRLVITYIQFTNLATNSR